MKVHVGQERDGVSFILHPEKEDLEYLEGSKISLGKTTATVEIPGISLQEHT